MKVLVTGASGFVGRAVCSTLLHAEPAAYSIVPAVRVPRGLPGECVVGEIDGKTDWQNWREALQGVHGVVHLAARVHVMNDRAVDPLTAFCSINTEGTLNLARQCAAAGVRRFVFISSIKVNGEERAAAYTEADAPAADAASPEADAASPAADAASPAADSPVRRTGSVRGKLRGGMDRAPPRALPACARYDGAAPPDRWGFPGSLPSASWSGSPDRPNPRRVAQSRRWLPG